ncbi:MAG: hypothetical protein OXE77_04860 [Flavobacteriaceae bacterium]|nr:hypothetical protein [Flavobacteriaceae bacterium]MCY4267899.1 hypothetical protein [Flavobacteriaceae bacterium]
MGIKIALFLSDYFVLVYGMPDESFLIFLIQTNAFFESISRVKPNNDQLLFNQIQDIIDW